MVKPTSLFTALRVLFKHQQWQQPSAHLTETYSVSMNISTLRPVAKQLPKNNQLITAMQTHIYTHTMQTHIYSTLQKQPAATCSRAAAVVLVLCLQEIPTALPPQTSRTHNRFKRNTTFSARKIHQEKVTFSSEKAPFAPKQTCSAL